MPSLSVSVRNAMLNALVATVGASPTIQVRTGSAPSINSEPTGDLLVTFTLGTTWADAAADGAVAFTSGATAGGTPVVASATAVATGTAGHFRLLASNGTVHVIGTVSEANGGGDLILDTVSTIAGVAVIVTSWFLHTRSG